MDIVTIKAMGVTSVIIDTALVTNESIIGDVCYCIFAMMGKIELVGVIKLEGVRVRVVNMVGVVELVGVVDLVGGIELVGVIELVGGVRLMGVAQLDRRQRRPHAHVGRRQRPQQRRQPRGVHLLKCKVGVM